MTRARKALMGGVVALAVLAAAEGAVRLLFADELAEARGGPPPAQDGAPTMKGNPYLLWEQAPGVRTEHGVTATINSLGLRGPEPVIPKPEGTRRLLVTGDSSVYGFGVGDDKPFIQVAARLLGVEGHNAAIPGYSTLQTINLLEMRALALEPDVLVIANQWSDNNFDSFVDRELLSAYTAFDESPRASLERGLTRLAMYRLLHWKWVGGSQQAQARKVGWTVGGGKQSGARRVAINDYAANIDRIASMAVDAGAELVFVVLPNREDLVHNPNPQAWTVYREVLRDAALRFGAPVVEGPALFEGGQGLFLDEMHPTAPGHEVLGQELARVLQPWAEGGTVMGPGTGGGPKAWKDPFVFGNGGQASQPQAQTATVSGLVYWSQRAPVTVEALDLARSDKPSVGSVELSGPGPFSLGLSGGLTRVGFRVSSQGQVWELVEHPLDLSSGAQGLVLNLDAGALQRDSPAGTTGGR